MIQQNEIEISGEITGLKYSSYLQSNLKTYKFNRFNINNCEPYCLLNDNDTYFAISKWVSPKRTRSYPYARIYNTLKRSRNITIIPIVKDEEANGDRDFIQWDTISLMSLLDVNVILAYYKNAEKVTVYGKDKINSQLFDNKFVKTKIQEIKNYQSSALHWNLALVSSDLNEIVNRAIDSYSKIEKRTGVKMHSARGLLNFKEKIFSGYENFMEFSRLKSSNASRREIKSKHKLEFLKTDTKAKINIKNYLGGLYNFTVDEAIIDAKYKSIPLIESKNSTMSKLPSQDDIKDGLLKMILYVNLQNVRIGDQSFSTIPVLNLTSTKILREFDSTLDEKSIGDAFETNTFNKKEKELLSLLFVEARTNNFIVTINKCT